MVGPTRLGSSALGPSRVLHKKKSTRAASAQPQLAPISRRSRKSSERSWTQTLPPPALLVPINVQCISPSEQRLVLECFYPTPDRTRAPLPTRSLSPAHSYLGTASPEDCMLRKDSAQARQCFKIVRYVWRHLPMRAGSRDRGNGSR